MVVLHFDDELRFERLPFARALGRPAAGPAGRSAGEAGGSYELLEPGGQLLALCGGEPRAETDLVERAAGGVEAQKQGTDELSLRRVAESADDAVGRAKGQRRKD